MWNTTTEGRSDNRADKKEVTTLNAMNAYHAAFSAVGRLMAVPFQLLPRLDQEQPDPMPNRRLQRTTTMTKVLRAAYAAVTTWFQRQRMMEELNGLSDRVLADIGLTREGIPAAVRQAYQPARDKAYVAAATVTVGVTEDSRPAASNDEVKQPLAA